MSIYEEVEVEDMAFDAQTRTFTYPCPCGDKFAISLDEMASDGEDIALCPSCTLRLRVVYDEEFLARTLAALQEEEDQQQEQHDQQQQQQDQPEEEGGAADEPPGDTREEAAFEVQKCDSTSES